MSNEELYDYENDVLQKIDKEEMFSNISNKNDTLGEYIDRVIERSLYLYKNR